MSFWSERLREAKYAINEEELRPYFALPQVCVRALQACVCMSVWRSVFLWLVESVHSASEEGL